MEAPGGVEPPTNGLGNRCSIQLSYGATRARLAVIGAETIENFTKTLSTSILANFRKPYRRAALDRCPS